MTDIQKLCEEHKEDMLAFLRQIIATPSETGKEEAVVEVIKSKMNELGFDEIMVSSHGDLIGVIGEGETHILFDSHIDTVVVNDADEWQFPPYGAHMDDTYIHGRGTVDMKSSVVSTVYGAYFAKVLGYTKDKTVYVCCSAMEEDFDAYTLRELIKEFNLKLDYAIICEPSNMQIALGHRGRAMFEIVTNGISAHGSAPENGKNAIYEMREIIGRVEKLNEELYKIEGEHGSVALTKIESETVSLNAIPTACKIYLDRRLALGENLEIVSKEMDKLVEGLDAQWNVYIAKGMCYTSKEINMFTFLEAWETEKAHPIVQAMEKAYKEQLGKDPNFFKWNFSTNGFATAEQGITTIGLGPGDMNLAHMRDEKCKIQEVFDCCATYTGLLEHM